MDKKVLTRLAITLAILSMFSFFTSAFPLMITGLGALAICVFAIKDKDSTARVLDPIVTATCVTLTSLIFTILQSISNHIINLCDNVNYNFTNGLSDTFRIINIIFIFVMIAAIIVNIIFVSQGKRVPVVSKISDIILDICTKKDTAAKQDSENNSENNSNENQ